jgi:hypothetical protein
MYQWNAPRDMDAIRQYRERGGCLTLWLVASIVFNVAAFYLLWQSISALSSLRIRSDAVSQAQLLTVVLGVMLVALLICLIAAWRWKRWGIIGIAIIVFASPVATSLILPVVAKPNDWITPLIQTGVLYWLVKDKWHAFE